MRKITFKKGDAREREDILRRARQASASSVALPTWGGCDAFRSCQLLHVDVPLDVWTEFCQRTTTLCEFSWHMGPFTVHHANAFASAPKPQLKTLRFEALLRYTWHDSVDFQPLAAVVTATPSIRSLQIDIAVLPSRHSLSATALDELVAHISRHSPHIESLQLVDRTADDRYDNEDDEGEPPSPPVQLMVGPSTLQLLLNHSILTNIEMTHTAVHDNTLANLLASQRSASRRVKLEAVGSVHAASANLLSFLENALPTHVATISLDLDVTYCCDDPPPSSLQLV